MRKLLFTMLLLLAGYVAYTYFFGQAEDKANAKVIVDETRDLGRAIGDLLSRQKANYDAGEVDKTLDRIQDNLDQLKTHPGNSAGEEAIRQLGRDLRQLDTTQLSPSQRENLRTLIREIGG